MNASQRRSSAAATPVTLVLLLLQLICASAAVHESTPVAATLLRLLPVCPAAARAPARRSSNRDHRPRRVAQRALPADRMASLRHPAPIVVEPPATATATVIFLHGLGDTGDGWADIAGQLHADKLRHVRFIFPTAPTRPVTINNGYRMPAWYDIKSLGGGARSEDEEGLLESKRYIEELVAKEAAAGVASTRVVVGGFSQGGAVSLLMLRSTVKLAAVVGLSTYLPLSTAKQFVVPENLATPVLMGHGDADNVVAYSWGLESRERLESAGVAVDFRTYNGMGHSSCRQELRDLQDFLLKSLPPIESS